jgi:carboxypeptidase PM20D1
MKKLLITLTLAAAVLAGTLVIRTLTFTSKQVPAEPVEPVPVDVLAAAERLAGAIRFPTISHQDSSALDGAAFLRLHAYLDSAFPRVRGLLEREVVSDYSVLYRWNGADRSLRPLVLLAHMDVVPVEPETESDWTHDAFGGAIAEGYVWGRGALDDKASLLAILEAVETLLAQGFTPRRTVYLAFGHDEEVGGRRGAVAIAEWLRARAIEPELVLDEGGTLADSLVPGVEGRPVALVGVAEKGYLTLELRAQAAGGHSSMPPRATAVGTLAAALATLQANPIPGSIRGATAAMFDHLGPELPFLPRLIVANRWLTGWLLEERFGRTPAGNAVLRTTAAPTIVTAGVKENVLPSVATAVVNFRIMPGETSTTVIQYVRRAVREPAVEIRPIGFVSEPSPVSDPESPAFALLARTIRQIHPDPLVIPYLVVGGTDARHYTGLTSRVFRFNGARIGPSDLQRVHGTDERVGVEVYADMIRFYAQLMKNSGE